MGDAERLLEAFETGSLVRPSHRSPNIVDLSRGLALLAGTPDAQSTPGSTAVADLIGQSDHLIFIMADGLGAGMVEQLPEKSFLPTHLAARLRTASGRTATV